MDISIMTFNLRCQTTADKENAWTYRKGAAAEVVNQYRPTLFGTQEGFSFMLADLEERLPDYAWVGEGRNGGTENEYNAIFYKKEELEVVDWGQFWLSEQPEGPIVKSWGASLHRICTWALFRFRDQPLKQFLHYNTHLDHSSELAREMGSRLIWDRLSEHLKRTPLPAMLTGDMNSYPDSAAIQLFRGHLTDAFVAVGVEPGLSFHGYKGGADGQPIDYVFVTPDVQVNDVVIIRDQMDGMFPSDHYPVQARVTL